MKRQLSVAELNVRRANLSGLRAHRSLIAAEQRELDNLDRRFYMREWRRQQRDEERALTRRLGA